MVYFACLYIMCLNMNDQYIIDRHTLQHRRGVWSLSWLIEEEEEEEEEEEMVVVVEEGTSRPF
jgi:hypothetical protein